MTEHISAGGGLESKRGMGEGVPFLPLPAVFDINGGYAAHREYRYM
jgi:hypothetical protein